MRANFPRRALSQWTEKKRLSGIFAIVPASHGKSSACTRAVIISEKGVIVGTVISRASSDEGAFENIESYGVA